MTKYIICLGDGMSDEPIKELGNKTPIEAATIPAMTQFAEKGSVGRVHTVPKGLHPGSDVTNMGILGYNPHNYYTGRGPIEAASMGITTTPDEVIFRCNLVTIENNIMKDFTAGHISNEEGAALLNELNTHFKGKGVTFYPGVGYRNIVVLDKKFNSLTTTAPHDITDQSTTPYLPKGDTQSEIEKFIEECHQILKNSPINKQREKENKKPANNIWPWSQGKMPILPSFKDTHGLTGGIITAVDLLKGLGVLAGLETPSIEGATGFIDTNYKSKLDAAFSVLETHDFVYIHIEAPDECGHMGDFKLKTQAISDFDKNIINPVLSYATQNTDTAVLILPDHPTPCAIKTHTSDPVPFIIYHPKLSPNSISSYSEKSSLESNLEFKTPWELLSYFLKPSN